MRDRKGIIANERWYGEELGGVKWGASVIKIYYIKTLFLMKEKKESCTEDKTSPLSTYNTEGKAWASKNRDFCICLWNVFMASK